MKSKCIALIVAVIGAILTPTLLRADSVVPQLCRSPYALMSKNFNYQAYRAGNKGVDAYLVTTLWNTFGTKVENYASELADPRVWGTELALLNETCVSGNRCGKYEVLYGYTSASLGRAIASDDKVLKQKVVASANEAAAFLLPRLRPDQKCFINPLLETHQNRDNVSRVVSWIAPAFSGRCEFVWNPNGGNPGRAAPGTTVSEGHGNTPILVGPNCAANPDGTPMTNDEYRTYLPQFGTRCRFACTWGPNDNCNITGTVSGDPRSRSCRETKDFAQLGAAMRAAQKPVEVPPAWSSEDDKSLVGCTSVLPNPDGNKGFVSKETDAAHSYAWTVLLPRINSEVCEKAGKKNCPATQYKSFTAMKAGKPLYDWPNDARHAFLYTEDGSMRQVRRATTNPRNAPFNVVLRATRKNGVVNCWKVPNPRERND